MTNQAKSPSAMNETDIRKAYDAMDANGDGELTALEVAEALQGMGVDLPKQELRELVYDVRGPDILPLATLACSPLRPSLC